MLSSRNEEGLTQEQIQKCQLAWTLLNGGAFCELDVSRASQSGSRTLFDERAVTVFLGADVYPTTSVVHGNSARSRMSVLACLAHELAHARRYGRGYRRPLTRPDYFIDEAETSLDASFELLLEPRDRRDLVEDARDQTVEWLSRFTGNAER